MGEQKPGSGEPKGSRPEGEKRDPLVKLKEHELWNKNVPGIKDWTMGSMIEELIGYGEFDPDTDSIEALYRQFLDKQTVDDAKKKE